MGRGVYFGGRPRSKTVNIVLQRMVGGREVGEAEKAEPPLSNSSTRSLVVAQAPSIFEKLHNPREAELLLDWRPGG